MATTFQVKRSSVAGKVPNTSTLSIGELGLNLTDQILYSSNGTGVFELGANVTNQTIKTSLLVGNSSVNTTVNSTSISIGANNLTVGTSLYAVSNGNVGIGTSSPSQQLEVNGSIKLFNGLVDGPQLVLGSSGYTDWYFDNNAGSLRAINGSTNRFTISSSGNVGIGTGSPSGKLHILNPNAGYLFTSNSTSNYTTTFNMDDTGLDIGHNSASRSINFLTNSLDRMTITSAGNVGIGTSSPSYPLDVNGNINSSNTVFAVHFDNVSDISLKENILPLNDSINKLNNLYPVSFNWKSTKEQSFGLIAQEVEQILPQIVHQKDDGTKTVSYIQIIALLIDAVKDLQRQIDDINSK